MFDKLGVAGVAGVLAMLVGIVLVAMQNVVIAAGLALMLAGTGLVVRGLLASALSAFGMDGML